MVGEGAVHLLEAVGVQLLERQAGRAVKGLSSLRQQALVRDVLRQRVLEDVNRLVCPGALVDELKPLELEEMGVQRS